MDATSSFGFPAPQGAISGHPGCDPGGIPKPAGATYHSPPACVGSVQPAWNWEGWAGKQFHMPTGGLDPKQHQVHKFYHDKSWASSCSIDVSGCCRNPFSQMDGRSSFRFPGGPLSRPLVAPTSGSSRLLSEEFHLPKNLHPPFFLLSFSAFLLPFSSLYLCTSL